MNSFFDFIKSIFSDGSLKRGDWIIFKNDIDVDFGGSINELKYNQVVQILEVKINDSVTIVDVGIRFKDSSIYSIDSKGFFIAGRGIKWIRLDRFKRATKEEVDRWLSENDKVYNRDKKLNQILEE